MITIFSTLLVFSVLILVHEAGHFIMAKKMGVRVEKFSFGFGPKLLSFKRGDTEYLICAIPLGGYVKMAGDEPTDQIKGKEWEYLSKSPFKRFCIVVAGPLTNYILAFLLFSFVFVLGVPAVTTEIGKAIKDSPAYSAGIKAQDKIVSINGKDIKYWDELLMLVSGSTSGKEMDLVILREQKPIHIKLVPDVIETKNIFGQYIRVGRIGIASAGKTTTVKTGIIDGLYQGGKKTIFLTGFTYKALWHMITGGMPLKESAMGPIGIAVEIGKAAKLGLLALLHLTALINLAIAIFNLLPIPVLDGGHIMFLGLEKIRGRRLEAKTEHIISNIAMALLLTLAIYVSFNDVLRNWGSFISKVWGNIIKFIK